MANLPQHEERVLFQDHWLAKSLEKLMDIQRLGHDWDGEGSLPITFAAVRGALSFLTFLVDVYGNELPAPFICPVSGGGIQLEWTAQDRHLEVEFAPDGRILFLQDEQGQMKTGELPSGHFHPLLRLLDWQLARASVSVIGLVG